MAPVQRATQQRRPTFAGSSAYRSSAAAAAGTASSSSSLSSRVLRVCLMLALMALAGYAFANTFAGLADKALLYKTGGSDAPALRQQVEVAVVTTTPKTALELAEEAGAKEAREDEEREAEEQEEEEVPAGDGGDDDDDEKSAEDASIQASREEEQQQQQQEDGKDGDDDEGEELEEVEQPASDDPVVPRVSADNVNDQEEEEEDAGMTQEDSSAAAVVVVDPNAGHIQVDAEDDDDEDEDASTAVRGNEEDDDDDQDDDEEVQQGPVRLPKYTLDFLEARGIGHLLYAYRVVASHVAIRTQPTPIGGMTQHNSKAPVGLVKDSVKHGDVVVGYALSKQFGLWLKLAPHTWIPVLKKDAAGGKDDSAAAATFHPLMKQIRKISLPRNLRRHWKKPRVHCATKYPHGNKRLLETCEEKNLIRDAVLQFMRRNKLMTGEMDPDLHPFVKSPVDGQDEA